MLAILDVYLIIQNRYPNFKFWIFDFRLKIENLKMSAATKFIRG